jgi:hypothetical protein
VALVVEGLMFADRYFALALEAQATGPIEVRLARRSPCIPFQPLRNAATAIADSCIGFGLPRRSTSLYATAVRRWQKLPQRAKSILFVDRCYMSS